MRFGRLKDTRFPNLDTVDVYAYRNEFDYTRWVAGTTIKMCNVLWNSDYSDVVKFDDNIKRDKWFNELQDYYTVTLDSDRSYIPEQEVKIPVPYDVAARYNYMVITIPVLPGSAPEINYEDAEAGIRKWYFFIDTIDYRSPNTTGCRISLDVWTQYQNDIDINYMMLQRGHAPVAYSDVDAYLANPIQNNKYLLAPDITPSTPDVVRSSKFVPMGNLRKIICFACTCPIDELTDLGTATHNVDMYTYGTITYSDVDARYGYQLQVNGYKVGDGDNYSALQTVNSAAARSQDIIPNGSYMYYLEARYMQGFIDNVMHDCPVFFRTVLACFVLDESFVVKGESVRFCGYTINECVDTRAYAMNVLLTKDMFNIPNEYNHLAKLYTFPYSELEITDNNGKIVKVRVENTGQIVAHRMAMLAYPFINYRVWFDGINGDGTISLMWDKLDMSTVEKDIPNSDWMLACFDMDIPCYALYMDPDTAWKLDNFYTAIRGGGKRALADYHSAVRNANTAKENAEDSNDTMYANTVRDANTLETNTDNTAECNRDNADLTIAANTQNTTDSNASSLYITTRNNLSVTNKTWITNGASSVTATADAEKTAATNKNTAAGGVWTGALSGAMAGIGLGAALGAAGGPIGMGGGAALGALGGIAAGMIGVQVAEDTSAVLINTDSATVGTMNAANVQTSQEAQDAALDNTNEQNRLRSKVNTTNNNAFSSQTDNTNATMIANAGNTADTMTANSDATRDTGNANAGYTRQVGVLNAKERLEASRDTTQFDMWQARMGAPVQVTPEKGNAIPDLAMTRGVQFKVKTIADGDMRQIGDTFLRYGYALNQQWNVKESGLCPMSHFCYWKAEDIWVDDRMSSNNYVQDIIVSMFMRGVTIWKNPDEVGKVDIHANK